MPAEIPKSDTGDVGSLHATTNTAATGRRYFAFIANSSIHKVLPAFPATLYDNLAFSTGNLSQVPERPIGFADRPRDRGALRKDVIGWRWNQRRGVVPLTSCDRCYWRPEKLSTKITVTHFVTITDERLSLSVFHARLQRRLSSTCRGQVTQSGQQ